MYPINLLKAREQFLQTTTQNIFTRRKLKIEVEREREGEREREREGERETEREKILLEKN